MWPSSVRLIVKTNPETYTETFPYKIQLVITDIVIDKIV